MANLYSHREGRLNDFNISFKEVLLYVVNVKVRKHFYQYASNLQLRFMHRKPMSRSRRR